MSIKTITTTLVLSFLTAVSFANFMQVLDLKSYIPDDQGELTIKINYKMVTQEQKCIMVEKGGNHELADFMQVKWEIKKSNGFSDIMRDIYKNMRKIPLNLILQYKPEVIAKNHNVLSEYDIDLNKPESLVGKKSIEILQKIDQTSINEKPGICEYTIEGTIAETTVIDLQKAKEFVEKSKIELEK